MKNRLTDLNDVLFAQLERLSDETLTAEQITHEVARADAIVEVADQIVGNARLQLEACEMVVEYGDRVSSYLPMIAPGSRAAEVPMITPNGKKATA